MIYDTLSTNSNGQSLPVYAAQSFTVTNGANLGDALCDASGLILDDIYGLQPQSRRMRIALAEDGSSRRFRVVDGSEIGRPGAVVHLDSALTFMSPDGSTVEALVFVEVTDAGTIAECYMLPLAPIMARRDYALVAVDQERAAAKLAEIACVSFARGTKITMANGMQKPIEELTAGDRVLTRDNGPRQIRWIGTQTVRATGAFAPILIAKGALNNSGDLMLSPNHRLFIYQRRDKVKAGRREVLVRAKFLVNGTTVVQSDGGFVDYFQLLFDQHEIIYAEGIAAESLFVDTRVRPAIPAEVADTLSIGHDMPNRDFVGRAPSFDLNEAQVDSHLAAELLRAASSC